MSVRNLSRSPGPSSLWILAVILLWSAAMVLSQINTGTTKDSGDQDRSSASVERVMTLSGYRGPHQLSEDKGASGLWQRLLKLRTTASAMHTTAHPDDEHGGVLTWLSRGMGVRTALLTLNRGEGGANAIGSELFDGLGLIRTQELILSGRHYGLDDQYFSTVIDYGYSKTLEEALEKWGRENVLRDIVRVIRINRPLVIVSRFHGTTRDGHGNHQTAGLVSQEAFAAAGDLNRFPEQIQEEGLRPWQPLKMYRGGVRPEERWHLRVDSGQYSPWLGRSYQQFSNLGLSLQRSQTSGRMREVLGPLHYYYERFHSIVESPEKERDFFDGIDTSIRGMFEVVGGTPPEGALDRLVEIEAAVEAALHSFNTGNPSAVVPDLARGLEATRRVLQMVSSNSDAAFLLRIKERQFMDAINTALGIEFIGAGVPPDTPNAGSAWGPLSTMGVVVPGQTFRIDTTFINRGHLPVQVEEIAVRVPEGWSLKAQGSTPFGTLGNNQTAERKFAVTVSDNPTFSDRYYYRESIHEDLYKLRDPRYQDLPSRFPAATASVRYRVQGVAMEIRETVRSREANLPYGYLWRELKVAPALAVNITPEIRVVPLGVRNNRIDVGVELINNHEGEVSGQLRLELPQGWTATPPQHAFRFSQAGERNRWSFTVTIPRTEDRDYNVEAVARAGGWEYRQGYQIIRHRDLETDYIYRNSVATVRGVDVRIASGLRVGYVMGVGDEVPAGIEQLGARVELLDERALAGADLQDYDAIVIGTRAYAVREDLITYNHRLLEYAKNGGNLIVLYQTQEFIPNRRAPYPADLPARSEEVSEEDSPIRILAPDHALFNRPNRITLTDFDNWVEQRGSKFFSSWDANYTPLIETQDRGQDPQQGGWVMVRYGRGHYTYCAYAFQRQLPFGVAGAYRLFANLLSLGK